MKRTESTISRLRQEPEVLKKYDEIIRKQERRGFIELVPAEKELPSQVHYIPHHPVKKNSSTTPVRIVYDCSCRQSPDQPSLNDCLESKPPVINDLTSILVRFRLHEFTVTTDIEKAFLHVGLQEKDRDFTRFLWLENSTNPNSQLTTYRFKSVLFGATCSPFMLNATLLKHLQLYQNIDASHVIERDLYVDNVISSFRRESDVLQYFHDARSLLSSVGMNLRSWTSNSDSLREKARSEGVLGSEPVNKVLGLRWEPATDTLSFAARDFPILTDITKKAYSEILISDLRPAWITQPCYDSSEIAVQDLWKLKYDCDVPLPADFQEIWTQIARDLSSITAVRFSRKLLPSRDNKMTGHNNDFSLHIFVDASINAYGASAYICNDDNSSLVIAKNRVALLTSLTLPQLELMAALTGARLAKHLHESLPATEITFWSDSQIVLHWLSTSKTLKRFVARRVTEIHELTKPFKWKYCSSSDNPADLLTRGIPADQLKINDMWHFGPSWLCDRNLWPAWSCKNLTVQSVLENEATVTAHRKMMRT